jgi:hypothetical protein
MVPLSTFRSGFRSVFGQAGKVLLVSNFLQPVDVLAIQRFLDRDVRHRRRRCRTMPMLVARGASDYIACADLDDRLAFALRPAAARGDDQSLSKWMGVPGRACTRLESHAGARYTRRRGWSVQWVDPDDTGKVFGGAFLRWL